MPASQYLVIENADGSLYGALPANIGVYPDATVLGLEGEHGDIEPLVGLRSPAQSQSAAPLQAVTASTATIATAKASTHAETEASTS